MEMVDFSALAQAESVHPRHLPLLLPDPEIQTIGDWVMRVEPS